MLEYCKTPSIGLPNTVPPFFPPFLFKCFKTHRIPSPIPNTVRFCFPPRGTVLGGRGLQTLNIVSNACYCRVQLHNNHIANILTNYFKAFHSKNEPKNMKYLITVHIHSHRNECKTLGSWLTHVLRNIDMLLIIYNVIIAFKASGRVLNLRCVKDVYLVKELLTASSSFIEFEAILQQFRISPYFALCRSNTI